MAHGCCVPNINGPLIAEIPGPPHWAEGRGAAENSEGLQPSQQRQDAEEEQQG